MTIIEKTYNWNDAPSVRSKTDYIVLHHMAGDGSADDVHRAHLANGWAGIGYHFFVRKDGGVYRGRPADKVGAHTVGINSRSVGICFEGNFQRETMNSSQLKAGAELIAYLKGMYPSAVVKKHGDFNATACPGKNFPFDRLTEFKPLEELTDTFAIVDALAGRGIVTDAVLWRTKCSSDTNAYWIARKIANLTQNSEARSTELTSANDIVWELAQMGIITDKALWLKLFEADKDLYWLGRKAANRTAVR